MGVTALLPPTTGLQNGLIQNWNLGRVAPFAAVIFVISLACGNDDKPSRFFLHLIVLWLVTPTLVLSVSGDRPLDFPMGTIAAFLLVAGVSRFFPLPTMGAAMISGRAGMWISAGMVFALIAAIFMIGDRSLINFDIRRVYEFRRAAAAALPPIFAYLVYIAASAILPIGTALALSRKSWGMVVAFVAAGVLIMALTAEKAPAFYPPAVICIYFGLRFKHPAMVLVALFAIVLAASAIDVELWRRLGAHGLPFGTLSSLMVRRAILIPSVLDWCYLDFFKSSGNYYWWSDSRITMGLVNSPFDLAAPNLVGRECFGNPSIWADTGWIGSGAANAGYIGITAYSVVIGLILSFLDGLAVRLGNRIVIAALALSMWTVTTGSDLLTTLLTHGFAMALVFLLLLRGPVEPVPSPARP
jgi:hypothetical protein